MSQFRSPYYVWPIVITYYSLPSIPTTLRVLLFLKHKNTLLPQGLWLKLFPLLGMFFSKISTWLTSSSPSDVCLNVIFSKWSFLTNLLNVPLLKVTVHFFSWFIVCLSPIEYKLQGRGLCYLLLWPRSWKGAGSQEESAKDAAKRLHMLPIKTSATDSKKG